MKVFDRILNKIIDISEVEKPIIVGRYIIASFDDKMLYNGIYIDENQFLVPCNKNIGSFVKDGIVTKIEFQANEIFDNEKDSLLRNTITEVSEEYSLLEYDIDYVREISPVLRNFDKRLEISDFEHSIHEKLFHIEEICRDPSSHLKRGISKVNIARAKRIPVKAVNYLAAHTEDWSRRRIRSVEPRKILSEMIEYDLGIYENKVTAGLIDSLLLYFNQRMIDEIEVIDDFINKIKVIIDSRKSTDSDKKLFWYKKLERDYEKLGSVFKDIDNNEIKVNKIKSFIISITLRLSRLLNSDLYRINSNNRISNQLLKRTNLFDNHQHYRFVKIFSEKITNSSNIGIVESSNMNQRTVKSYLDFTKMVMLRALYEIGYTSVLSNEIEKIVLSTEKYNKTKIEIIFNKYEIIEVCIGVKKLRFISIPYLKGLNMNLVLGKDTFVLSLENFNDNSSVIRINPSDINSEERLTRILFKSVLGDFVDDYQINLDSQMISQFKDLERWMLSKKDIFKNYSNNAKLEISLMSKLNKFEKNEMQTIFNKQKKHLNARSDIREKEICDLDEIFETINSADKHFTNYEKCVTCGVYELKSSRPNNSDGFRFKCCNSGCGVEYGHALNHINEFFYKVPYCSDIKMNICNDSDDILNSFGYECI